MLNASLNSEQIAKDPFKLHIRHILSSMETTSVQKIWIFHCRGSGGWGRILIAVFCVYDYTEKSFPFTTLWPIFGHCPLPLPYFQTSSTPNLHPEGSHTTCQTVWHLAQNLSSTGDPTGSYAAASAAFQKSSKAREFLYSAKYSFDKVGYTGTQGAIPQETTMNFSVNYS
jgi:hypothetical protein